MKYFILKMLLLCKNGRQNRETEYIKYSNYKYILSFRTHVDFDDCMNNIDKRNEFHPLYTRLCNTFYVS